MSLSIKTEKSLTNHEEFELLAQTRHPGVLALDDAALAAMQRRMRDLRDKERTLARGLRRGVKGKAEPRGGAFPGNVEKPTRRKQVFAGALKRVNGELARRQAEVARAAMIESAQRALDMKNAAGAAPRPASRKRRTGMASIQNERAPDIVNRAAVGSISQANKNAQAAKDARG
ncbi:MAG: hypothetical protein QM651_17460 [Rhodoblastus sp.]